MERILITNWKESRKTQLELFEQGYKWFTDVKYDKQHEEKELMLKSTKMVYPIFINKGIFSENNKILSWSGNSELNTTLKKEFRKQKLKRLNESAM